MSGIEVVAAVSAVVSAFHAGSELLKHIKAKRRKARQAQQEFEEKQLQDSLVSGEQQIGIRYAQDMRQFGDLMRVGDVIARDRLLHITIMMQGEVIKSLQMAAQYENAIINLTLLHEASITNKKDTFVTLDELKQRLLIRKPISRQLQGVPERLSTRSSVATVQTVGTSTFNPTSLIPDNYVPAAVTLPPQRNMKDSKSALSSYFRLKRNSSTSTASGSDRSSTAADINYSEALQQLVAARGSGVMKDIDEIIGSYQGLHMSPRSSDLWGNNQLGGGYGPQRDTLVMFNEGDAHYRDSLSPTREALQMPKNLPPSPGEYRPESPTFNPNAFDNHTEQQPQSQQYTARNPYPQMQMQASQPRWSASSSTYSELSSLGRNSSTSSQDSHAQTPPLPLKHSSRNTPSGEPPEPLLDAPYQYQGEQRSGQSPPVAHYASPEERYISPTAPLSPQTRGQSNAHSRMPSQTNIPTSAPDISHEESVPLMHSPSAAPYQQSPSYAIAPFAQPQQPPGPVQGQRSGGIIPSHTRYHLVPSVARDGSSMHSNTSERIITQSIAPTTALGTAPAVAGLRHASIALSIASTDSSGSGTLGILPGPRMSQIIRTGTIRSGPAGSEKMLEGRPCKANNYWGFCKGAWTIREDVKKGLALRTQPSGLYNTREIWECTSCTFKGATFSAPHPTKKNKVITIIDPRIATSESGIRYKWIFLAKSHVKKKVLDSHTDESNYCCVLCSVEGNVSSVYGGVETLMNHIALSHVADMSEQTRKKANCILGRVAGSQEMFDLNIPIFAQVEELAS